MDFMAEVNEVRQVVNFGPDNRLACRPTVPPRLKQLGIGPDLRMAVHAGPGRRDTRIARLLNRRMAVLALKSQSLHMVFVAERNWLVGTLPLAGHPRRPLQLIQRDA